MCYARAISPETAVEHLKEAMTPKGGVNGWVARVRRWCLRTVAYRLACGGISKLTSEAKSPFDRLEKKA